MTAPYRLVNTQKLFARQQITPQGQTSGNTVTNTTPQLMRDFGLFAAIAAVLGVESAGNTGLTQLAIYGCSDAAGTVNPTLIASTGTIAGSHAGDYAALEISEQEVIQACDLAGLDTDSATLTAEALVNAGGADETSNTNPVEYGLPYVFVSVTTANASDNVAITTIMAEAKAPCLNLTASVLG
jgi:hypothetical protein